MAQSTPYQLECSARDRLERHLHEERQRIKEACIQVTDIDPDSENSQYEALVSAMMDALDRRVILDNAAQESRTPLQTSDVFDGIVLKRGALDALVAHLRNVNLGNEQSADRHRVLSKYIHDNLTRGSLDSPVGSHWASIDWEDLAKRMDALRVRLFREIEEHRARPRRQRHVDGGALGKPSDPSSSVR